MDLGSLLRAHRKSKGKTLSETGDALAIDANAVWELEQNRGTMAGLEKVCGTLGLEWAGLAPGPTLGARVREERLRKGWSQETLSEKAGVSRPAIARVEGDRAHISTLNVV